MQFINDLGTLLTQPILNADTYKATHWTFEHPEFEKSYGYIEARKGGAFTHVQFFGLQYALRYYLLQQVTTAMIDEAEAELSAHGVPFNRVVWDRIVEKHAGYLPVLVRALPEGTVVDQGTVLVTVESTDEECAGIAAYVETMLLRAVWYPTTIATRSMRWHNLLENYLTESGTPELADWLMVDFGARGAQSTEAAAIGGMAHLVNFQVTDNLMGIRFAKHAYQFDGMPGFSIPATEHSVTTSWGRENEMAFFERILEVHGDKQFLGGGRYPVSVVIDTYDQDTAIGMWLKPAGEGGLLERLKASNMRLVVRPDSGDPIINVVHCLDLIGRLVGWTVNDKGYRVLPDYVRLIQGDGINEDSLRRILQRVTYHKWSVDNLVFGSGGGLLVHEAERDTHRFAMKTSYVQIAGMPRDVRKEVATDPSKASKAGRFAVVRADDSGKLQTISQCDINGRTNHLVVVYANSVLLNTQKWEQVRKNAADWRRVYQG
jgi:nicotinamide phosphoribosyltransferase